MKTFQSCLILGIVAAGATLSASQVPITDVLNKATDYVCRYVREFSTVVAEEHYAQGTLGDGKSERVDLTSDFLFVRPQSLESWLTFRDVYSVNGKAVRDREERLARLFVNEQPGAIDRATEIAQEGYRYNVGLKERTVANPLIALAFLQPGYRDRFDFRLDRLDVVRGADVWIVKFKERARPTILRTIDNRNAASMGRFWIEGASGRILQTELETSTGDKVMTIFAHDDGLQLDVPVEMRDIAWLNGAPITGAASYTNFRRFGVSTHTEFP